jgi:general secretion pathway protein E
LAARFGLTGTVTTYEPVGCSNCRGTGFAGRIAVAELIVPDETIHRLILSRASHGEIEKAACAVGTTTMYQNGLRQVLAGTTSLGEILRTVRLEG